MPRLMTSFIVVTMSKKSRMPERGMSRTTVLMRLRSDGEPFIGRISVHQDAEALVGFEHEMGGRGQIRLPAATLFADERRDGAEIATFDEQQQVMRAAHQIRGAHFGEFADAFRDVIEPHLRAAA